jgi:hypothetical protein
MKTRVVLWSVGVVVASGLVTSASGFEIARTKTAAAVQTSPSGTRAIQLSFSADLVNEGGPNFSEDVFVGWQEAGGIDPVPFRVLIPEGCFIPTRRGFRMEDFKECGVQLTSGSSARGVTQLEIVDFDAKVARRDDGITRFDLMTSFIPPDPIVPPDPIFPPDPVHAFLGIVGGAAVQIVVGSEMSASPPLRTETVSGIDPNPF